MPENVNWSAVWQSVTDTWIPLFGGIAVIVIAIIVIHIIRKSRLEKSHASESSYSCSGRTA